MLRYLTSFILIADNFVMSRAVCQRLLFFIFMMVFLSNNTVAGPLNEAQCKILLDQKSKLLEGGVGKYLEKGPDWAKSELEEAELRKIKDYLTVTDWLTIRCDPEFLKEKVIEETAELTDQPSVDNFYDDTNVADRSGGNTEANKVEQGDGQNDNITHSKIPPLPVRK